MGKDVYDEAIVDVVESMASEPVVVKVHPICTAFDEIH